MTHPLHQSWLHDQADEAARLAADRAANQHKAERAAQREAERALDLQQRWLHVTGQLEMLK